MTQPTETPKPAAPHANGSQPAIDENRILALPLKDVHADHAWNGRHAGPDPTHPAYAVYAPMVAGQLVAPGASLSDDEGARAPWSTSFAGLVEAIRVDGQDDEVTVRPTPPELKRAANGKPWLLTEGFRRFEAVRLLHEQGASIKNVPPGTIRAVAKLETEAEALLHNGRENMARENLPAPDVCFLIQRYVRAGMSGVEIAKSTTRAESYVSQLKFIGEKVKPNVLSAWRNCATLDGKAFARKHLSVDVMERIGQKEPGEQEAEYTKACEGAVVKPPNPNKATAWLESAKKRGEGIGRTIGALAFLGVLEVNRAMLAKAEKSIGELVALNPPKKKDETPAQRENKIERGGAAVAKALLDGYNEEIDDRKKAAKKAEAKSKAEKEQIQASGK